MRGQGVLDYGLVIVLIGLVVVGAAFNPILERLHYMVGPSPAATPLRKEAGQSWPAMFFSAMILVGVTQTSSSPGTALRAPNSCARSAPK